MSVSNVHVCTWSNALLSPQHQCHQAQSVQEQPDTQVQVPTGAKTEYRPSQPSPTVCSNLSLACSYSLLMVVCCCISWPSWCSFTIVLHGKKMVISRKTQTLPRPLLKHYQFLIISISLSKTVLEVMGLQVLV